MQRVNLTSSLLTSGDTALAECALKLSVPPKFNAKGSEMIPVQHI